MDSGLAVDDVLDARPVEAPKTRSCLRCGTKFESRWSGERICPRCKGSAAWRQGNPAGSE